MVVLEQRPYQLKHTAICIGKFDGLHAGHRLLIDSIKTYQEKLKVLFTFSFLESEYIYSKEEKRYLAERLGIDVYIDCPFDDEFCRMPPEKFLEQVLRKECGAEVISVGEDFRFGYRRGGDVQFLQNRCALDGFELNVFPKKEMAGSVVSSTRIRTLLREGDIQMANRLLFQPYFIYGTVCRGNRLGSTKLNMPTANQIPAAGKILPPFGVYASQVQIHGRIYAGVTNIGIKPTIPGGNTVGAETHIIGFDGDLYGVNICVELCAFLRKEQRFSGLELLRDQMEKDKDQACRMLENLK